MNADFARDVRVGLGRSGQKEVPPAYFYDDVGSALFEAITHLPQYGLTRADERVLRACAPVLAERMAGTVEIAELGSGSGRKTRILLEALHSAVAPISYYPIDVSRRALENCIRELSPVACVQAVEADYLDGLAQVSARRQSRKTLLALFLGSTIGNFDPTAAAAFLRSVSKALRPGDCLLLGADLVKPEHILLDAYDDPIGVTAAFNLNLLARMNRELGASFDVRRFTHEARYNSRAHRVEMHLRSSCTQMVHIPGADIHVSFEAGETIWTESSYKFDRNGLRDLADAAGFEFLDEWIDDEWPFAECLWRVPT